MTSTSRNKHHKRQRKGNPPEKALNRRGQYPMGVQHQKRASIIQPWESAEREEIWFVTNTTHKENKISKFMTNMKGRKKTVMTKGMHRGFRRGVDAVPGGQYNELKKRLTTLIGGATRSKLYYYINGMTIIRPDMSKQIEAIFADFGIKPKLIWDN